MHPALASPRAGFARRPGRLAANAATAVAVAVRRGIAAAHRGIATAGLPRRDPRAPGRAARHAGERDS
jgi:hypothetical protein